MKGFIDEGEILQLHNLVGQVLAEGGLIGTLAFLMFLRTFFKTSKWVRVQLEGSAEPMDQRAAALNRCLKMSMWLMLFYGLFTHNLYRFHWFLFAGMLSVLAYEVRQRALPKPSHARKR